MDQLDFNKLWQNFTDTIAKHYVDFDGRVGRSQFWCYVAVYALVGILVSVVGSITFTGGGLRSLYGLAVFLPSLGITARRLHDTGRTASWVLLLAVPGFFAFLTGLVTLVSLLFFGFLGFLIVFGSVFALLSAVAILLLLYFCVQPGTPGPNEYGAVPAAWSPYGTPVAPVAPPPPAAG
jgi:uncharacterized membrane protein YhaH (DUF805 family)